MINDTDSQIKELRQTIYVMELVFNAIDESVIYLNKKNEIEWCNSVFDKLVDRDHITVLGKNFFDVFNVGNIRAKNQDASRVVSMDIQDDVWIINECSYLKGNQELFLQISCVKHIGIKEAIFVVIIRDITQQKKLSLQLEHLAHYDILTNIPNRLHLQTHLERELSKAKRHARQLSIFFVDLNKFKEVNDTYGHAVGDLLLKAFSERLQKAVREEDFVSRIGGDEFIVVASELTDSAVQKISEKIKASLNNPYNIAGITMHNTASLGVSIYPKDGETAEALIHLADQRMYEEKQSKKSV